MMAEAWRESIAVARAKGVPLPATMFDQMQSTIDALPPTARSSMLEDLERGRRLELPWLSGAMVRIANWPGSAILLLLQIFMARENRLTQMKRPLR